MHLDHRAEPIGIVGSFHRQNLYFVAALSILPRMAFLFLEPILHAHGIWRFDAVALGIFFLLLILCTWRARSVLDYLVAVSLTSTIHLGFFIPGDIEVARCLKFDEFNILDNPWPFLSLRWLVLALTTALLSLPVFLIRRLKP